jgi:hypothetical protein
MAGKVNSQIKVGRLMFKVDRKQLLKRNSPITINQSLITKQQSFLAAQNCLPEVLFPGLIAGGTH